MHETPRIISERRIPAKIVRNLCGNVLPRYAISCHEEGRGGKRWFLLKMHDARGERRGRGSEEDRD